MEYSVVVKVVILLCLETQRSVMTLFWLLTLEIWRSCTHLFASWRLAAGYLSFLKFSTKQGKNTFSLRSSDLSRCLYGSRPFYLCFNEYLVVFFPFAITLSRKRRLNNDGCHFQVKIRNAVSKMSFHFHTMATERARSSNSLLWSKTHNAWH